MSTSKFIRFMKMCSIALILMFSVIVAKAGEFPFLFHAHDASGNLQTAVDEINARLKSIGVTNTLASNIVVQASTLNNGLTVTGGGINITGASTFTNGVTFIGDGTFNGNIIGDGSTVFTNMAAIHNTTLTASGDITANGNLLGDQTTVVSAMADVQSDQFSFYTNSGAVVIGYHAVIDGTNYVFINTGLTPNITNSILADISN